MNAAKMCLPPHINTFETIKEKIIQHIACPRCNIGLCEPLAGLDSHSA